MPSLTITSMEGRGLSERLELGDGEIAIWYRLTNLAGERARRMPASPAVSPAHQFLRRCLSRHADVNPGDWRFGKGGRGRPYIEHPAAFADLSFNLSHTRGLIAAIIARGCAVGIDVEHIRRHAPFRKLARRYFAAEEADRLDTAPEGALERQFLELWTLKEAYVKARGLGMALPFSSFQFYRDRDGSIRLTGGGETAGIWQFRDLCPTPDHIGAIAVEGINNPTDLTLHTFRDSDLR